jgi:hypothetical protein
MGNAIKNRKRRRKLWERDPHCYWCGIETVWHEENAKQAINAATIDHIRSRYMENRPDKGEGYRPGILVLACWKCNNERARIEQEFLAAEHPEEFRERNGSKKASDSLMKCQSKLATIVMRYVEQGRILEDSRIGRQIRGMSAQLRREYRKHGSTISGGSQIEEQTDSEENQPQPACKCEGVSRRQEDHSEKEATEETTENPEATRPVSVLAETNDSR